MRIPVYEQQRSVSAPQIRATEVAKPLDLSKAIDFVENRYEQGVKEKERGDKLFAANEMSRVDIALQQKYAEIEARIADGGDYAEAEKEYADYFNETTNESMQRFGPTTMLSAGVKSDYQRSGLEYGLKIKGAVRQRAKADASDNFNTKLELYMGEASNISSGNQRFSVMNKMTDEISKAVSMGVMSKAEADGKLLKLANDVNNFYIENNPIEFLQDYKANPKSYSDVAGLDKKVKLAKEKIATFEKQAIISEQYNKFERHTDQLRRAMDGKLTPADMEDTESPVIKALAAKTAPTKIDPGLQAAALVKYDKGLDELSSLVQDGSDPKKIVAALDEYQASVLADAGKSITGAQAASLVKTSQNLFFSKNPDGTIKQFDFEIDPGDDWAIIGIGQPNKVMSRYLDERMPQTLTGADRVRYKLAFSDAFERNLNKDGPYQASSDYSKDKEKVQSAINAAQVELATKSNPALLGVDGTPNRIIGSGKDDPVSNFESTAKPTREAPVDYKIMQDAAGNRARVYNDGRIEEIPAQKKSDQSGGLEKKINYTSRDGAANGLLDMGLRKEAVAGILGNIDVETGGTFDPSQKQHGGNGHGLFQFDFMKSHYNDWRDGKPDNTETQLAFMQDVVYGNSQDIIGEDNAAKLRKSFETGSAEDVAVDFMEIFERPGKPHKERRIRAAQKHLQEI